VQNWLKHIRFNWCEICHLDDILVTGLDDKENLTNLQRVFERLEEYGVQLKKTKCSFMCNSGEYLGYKIDAKGLHTTPIKVEAIQQAPHPKNIQQLRSFLGLVHYYGKFSYSKPSNCYRAT